MTPLVGFTLRGRGGNLLSVTGAGRPVRLGSITPGRLGHDLLATLGTRLGGHTAWMQSSIFTGAVD
jgi:hypothetical protein